MPINQDGSGRVVYTAPGKKALFDQTGAISDADFSIFDDQNQLKQFQFSINPTTTGTGKLTLEVDVAGDQTINLSTLGGGNSFTTMQPITGTSPTAASSSDTLTFTSSDNTIGIAGDSTTDTLDVTFKGIFTDGTEGTPGLRLGSDPDNGLYKVAADSLGMSIGGTRRVTFNTTGTKFDSGTVSIGGDINTNAGSAKLQTIGSLAVASLTEGGFTGTTPAGGYMWGVGGDLGGTAGLVLHGGTSVTGGLLQMLLKGGVTCIGLNLGINQTTVSSSGYNLIVHDRIATTGSTRMAIQAGAGQSTRNLLEFQASNSTLGGGTVLASVSAEGKMGIASGSAAAPSLFGTSDADSGVSWLGSDVLSIATAATERARVNSTGQWGFRTAANPDTDFHVKVGATGMRLEAEGAAANYRKWDWIPTNSGTLALRNADLSINSLFMDNGGRVAVGGANSHHFSVHRLSTSTTPATLNFNQAVISVRNSSNTVNNWQALLFENYNYSAIAGIVGINENHNTDGTATGHMQFFTRNAGTYSEKLRITAAGKLRFSGSQYSTGAGTPQLGSNCPASTLTAPNTWLEIEKSDGTTVYVPAWA